MALQNTNLLIQGSVLPATFKGTPNDLFVAMLQRMKIVSPSGQSFFIISDTEPSSNLGPWLKNGRQWWIFDSELKRYVPIDISASEKIWFQISVDVPATAEPPLWLRVAADGNPVSWNWWNGAEWIDFTSLKDRSVTAAKLHWLANFYATTSGVNDYTVSIEPGGAPFSYGDGFNNSFFAIIKFANANTGAVTLEVNGAGARPVKKNGSDPITSGEITAGSIHLLAYDGTNFQIQTPLIVPASAPPVVPGDIVAFSDGLVIQNAPGSPTTTVNITAQRVILGTSSGAIFSTFSVVESIDITVAGLGGLDTITTPESASTWYFIWLVSNGSDVSAVFSTSSTSPVLPADYIYTALLGAIYNNVASDLIGEYQTGRRIGIDPVDTASFGPAVVTTLDLSTIIPTIATFIWGCTQSSALVTATIIVASGVLTEGPGGVGFSAGYNGALDTTDFFTVPIKSPQTIDVAASGAGGSSLLRISGFTI